MINKLPEIDDVFDQLRPLLARHASSLKVARDEPGAIELESTKVTPSGTAMWFGSVKTGESDVKFHLMPVYSHPALLADVGAPLRERMEGKGCFNFTRETLTPAIVEELSALVDAGLARYRADGLA
jgi:hypothetical protein